MIEDGEPDHTSEALLMTMPRLASELRDLGKRTRPTGADGMRRAILFEAASRLESRYAYQAALDRDNYRRRGLDAFGNEVVSREDDEPDERA